MHHNIVALDHWHVPIPPDLIKLPAPHSYSLTRFDRQHTSAEDIQEKVKDATIIVVTVTPLNASTLSVAKTPNLQLVVAIASGTDGIDKAACAQRGILVVNSTNSNTDAVANHVLAQYFACRRRLLPLHHAMLGTNAWKQRGTLTGLMNSRSGKPPLSCKEEVVGIIGNGAIGQKVAQMCQGLGMTTLIAARKGARNASTDSVPPRTPFTQVITQSTVIVLCLPRNSETMNTISDAELQIMSTDTILINVSRGGVVNEEVLLKALKDGLLGGCAADVFLREPSGAGDHWEEGDSPILNVSQAEAEAINLLVTPHVAWYTKATVDSYLQTLQQNIVCWLEGRPTNIVV